MIEGVAELPGVRLGYWDTQGNGPPVVLLHAGTGSLAVWEHQRDAFRAAGFRVVGYSRRGHLGSECGAEDDPGTGSGDLRALLDHLGIGTCHLMGTAAGAIVALDFCLSFPQRVRSVTLACTILGVTDPDHVALNRRLRPPAFDALPPDLKELGPSYRAENPEGTARWMELEHRAIPGRRVRQGVANAITWAALRGMTRPCLLITGDADLWAPPAVLRIFARRLPQAETLVIVEAGHSAHWEQPEAFNRAVIDFIARHA